MSTQNKIKINQLVNLWPKGAVFVTTYLSNQGYNLDLIKRYRKSQWIDSIGTGALKLNQDNVEWYGAVYAFQKQLELNIHPGGKTALELLGYSHYLSETINKLFLFGLKGETLPTWYKKNDWQVDTIFSSNQLFRDTKGLIRYKYRDFEILISSPERAIMEMLYHFPKHHTFDECYRVMENLVGLRSDVCQNLLEQCNSVKVKRMFMFLAEVCEHFWLEEIDLSKVYLGSGKRVLVSNGHYIEKYNITVPKEYKI